MYDFFYISCFIKNLIRLFYYTLFSNNVEDENRKNHELSGLNKQASWVMDMMYSRREDEGSGGTGGRRDSLSNIQDLASRITSLQQEGGEGGNARQAVEANAQVCHLVYIP